VHHLARNFARGKERRHDQWHCRSCPIAATRKQQLVRFTGWPRGQNCTVSRERLVYRRPAPARCGKVGESLQRQRRRKCTRVECAVDGVARPQAGRQDRRFHTAGDGGDAEMYFHHDLNMGTAHVSVDGRTVARVPTCCTTDCVPSAPGQGFTFRVPVATGLAPVAHEVTIIAEPSNASMCAAQAAARNYQLDLFSVIATNVTRPLKNRHQMGNAQVDV